jgi:hypothetical protein
MRAGSLGKYIHHPIPKAWNLGIPFSAFCPHSSLRGAAGFEQTARLLNWNSCFALAISGPAPPFHALFCSPTAHPINICPTFRCQIFNCRQEYRRTNEEDAIAGVVGPYVALVGPTHFMLVHGPVVRFPRSSRAILPRLPCGISIHPRDRLVGSTSERREARQKQAKTAIFSCLGRNTAVTDPGNFYFPIGRQPTTPLILIDGRM